MTLRKQMRAFCMMCQRYLTNVNTAVKEQVTYKNAEILLCGSHREINLKEWLGNGGKGILEILRNKRQLTTCMVGNCHSILVGMVAKTLCVLEQIFWTHKGLWKSIISCLWSSSLNEVLTFCPSASSHRLLLSSVISCSSSATRWCLEAENTWNPWSIPQRTHYSLNCFPSFWTMSSLTRMMTQIAQVLMQTGKFIIRFNLLYQYGAFELQV